MGVSEEPRTGVDDMERRKPCPYRNSNSDLLGRPALRQSLYLLIGTTDKLCSFLEFISKELILLAEVKLLVAEQTSHMHNPCSRLNENTHVIMWYSRTRNSSGGHRKTVIFPAYGDFISRQNFLRNIALRTPIKCKKKKMACV
jgi:hypothetical protein